ncbi:MAG: hypothetical protein HN736_06895 [Anaerolineae bacterium]|nr:hypothetical protein [Anaerolineae bacterium]MBT4311928.1 hypothetical protein [Anaerolineae bacterium]MBT4459607.1 hypothetical protein [Anaerolineae bacterium]MBT4841636.1 hypothetical protein [Anaerolineae bacterium]MBT6060181.1 hypothetical protein [Anaerolineae bacterium]
MSKAEEQQRLSRMTSPSSFVSKPKRICDYLALVYPEGHYIDTLQHENTVPPLLNRRYTMTY